MDSSTTQPPGRSPAPDPRLPPPHGPFAPGAPQASDPRASRSDGHGPDASAPDPQRIASLYDETSDLVYRTARRITGRPEDAEDVLQTVFLRFVRHHDGAAWPDNPAAWLRRTAVNASLDVLRRRKRRPEDELDETREPRGAGLDEQDVAASRLDRLRLAERLRAALSLLTPLEAEVFTLRFVEQLGNAEIAEALDKTPNHVGVTLHAARRKLRDRLLPPTGELAPTGDAR